MVCQPRRQDGRDDRYKEQVPEREPHQAPQVALHGASRRGRIWGGAEEVGKGGGEVSFNTLQLLAPDAELS